MMEFKIVFVKWIDSTYLKIDYCEPETEIESLKPKILYTVGFLVHEDSDCIVLCQDVEFNSETSRMVISIPKVSIKSYEIKKIKVKSFYKEK